MRQAHIYVSGFVQGVGFRAYVRSKAKKMGLTGWVRNLSDGRVEAIIQGEKEAIDSVLNHTKRGSFFSKVQNVVIDWEEISEQFSEFKKLPTV